MARKEDSFENSTGPAPGHELGRFKRLERATALHANNFIIRRIENFKEVRRTALVWVGCAIALVVAGVWQINAIRPLYSHVGPAPGGAYIEGSVGQIDTLNPIFATKAAERSASRLLFASLLTTDDNGQYVGQLANTWSIDSTGKTYTVTLKPGLKWSDGVALTSRDVVFTVQTIQNPAVRSPYASAWREVLVAANDDRTVTIKLPSEYAPFLGSLTVGLLPEHLLGGVQPERLHSANFNTQPVVGSGPFSFRSLISGRSQMASQDINLAGNKQYYQGLPKLDRFTLRFYKDADLLTKALREREVMAALDIPQDQLASFKTDGNLRTVEVKPYNGVYAFFKQSSPPLDDVKVRQALELAIDRPSLLKQLSGVDPIDGPLLPGQLGYDPSLKQADYDLTKANQLLDEAGWKREGTVRKKDGQTLHLNLVSIATGNYGTVQQALQKAWSSLGVEIESSLVRQEEFQSSVISPHSYDVLVYELALGRDSDLFAYWHSSQAEPGRLNLSEYRSPLADEALNSGRIRNDPVLRAIKYRAFTAAWLSDVPAIALYRPQVAYLALTKTSSVKAGEVGDVADRFNNVVNWTAETDWLDNTR